MSSWGSPKNSVPPPSSSWTSERSRTPIVADEPLQLLLSFLGVEEGQKGSQVCEVENREPLLIGVAEDEREALLLRLVRLEDLREQQRAEVGDGGPDRHSGTDAADREELRREPFGLPVLS